MIITTKNGKFQCYGAIMFKSTTVVFTPYENKLPMVSKEIPISDILDIQEN